MALRLRVRYATTRRVGVPEPNDTDQRLGCCVRARVIVHREAEPTSSSVDLERGLRRADAGAGGGIGQEQAHRLDAFTVVVLMSGTRKFVRVWPEAK